MLPGTQNAPIHIRTLTRSDLSFADLLRALAGWNQTVRDWEDFLALSPGGCFLAECEGAPAGTVTTIRFDDQIGWIGMLLVHPDYRKRGIGRALLDRAIVHLKGEGVRCIKLDATPQGKVLYDKLGFKSDWPLIRWQAAMVRIAEPTLAGGIRACAASDFEAITALDREGFGTGRGRLLQRLLARVDRALVCEANGIIEGCGLLRSGARAKYLGPVVAKTNNSGTRLVLDLLRHAPSELVFWDIPDDNTVAVDLAKSLGFTPQRPLLRMALGAERSAGDPTCYFGIVDPALG